jgi:hypothetical protein
MIVTPVGKEVLAGKRDWQTMNQQPRWLGGVAIPPSPECWRWDPTEKQLVAPGKN